MKCCRHLVQLQLQLSCQNHCRQQSGRRQVRCGFWLLLCTCKDACLVSACSCTLHIYMYYSAHSAHSSVVCILPAAASCLASSLLQLHLADDGKPRSRSPSIAKQAEGDGVAWRAVDGQRPPASPTRAVVQKATVHEEEASAVAVDKSPAASAQAAGQGLLPKHAPKPAQQQQQQQQQQSKKKKKDKEPSLVSEWEVWVGLGHATRPCT